MQGCRRVASGLGGGTFRVNGDLADSSPFGDHADVIVDDEEQDRLAHVVPSNVEVTQLAEVAK